MDTTPLDRAFYGEGAGIVITPCRCFPMFGLVSLNDAAARRSDPTASARRPTAGIRKHLRYRALRDSDVTLPCVRANTIVKQQLIDV